MNSSYNSPLPRLWCPLLTHFSSRRTPDETRIERHLAYLSPWVHGLLIPGSTGEGWEMDDRLIEEVLSIVLQSLPSQNMRVLIGILKTETAEVLRFMDRLDPWLQHPAVAGITVCAAKGKERSPAKIQHGLEMILARGIATAIYQLPQVTENEIEPSTIAELAARFENFILFKDTSGTDRVALSGLDFGNVFMVRGSEQNGYARWTKFAGGPYDGFLLSTANVFASFFEEMLRLQMQGDLASADQLSRKIEAVVTEAFKLVAELPYGNPFTNANKLIDHFLAHGHSGLEVAAPLLISGTRLPSELLVEMHRILSNHSIEIGDGYLNA